MAHFAQLDDADRVLQVIVVSNNEIQNLPFPESEPVGIAFCQMLYGMETRWAQTSYNASFRANYAGAGFTFDRNVAPYGVFIEPQPYPSWTLNTDTYRWEPPVPCPPGKDPYMWDEASQTWVKI